MRGTWSGFGGGFARIGTVAAFLVLGAPAAAQIQTVLPLAQAGDSFIVENDRIYLTRLDFEFCTGSRVWTTSTSGEPPVLLDPNSGGNGCDLRATELATGGASVYGAFRPQVLRFYALGGAPLQQVAPCGQVATNFDADDNRIYIESTPDVIESYPLDGGARIAMITQPGTPDRTFMAPGDGYLYFIRNGDIYRWDGVQNALVQPLETGATVAEALWVDATYAWYIGRNGTTYGVYRVPVGGGSQTLRYTAEGGTVLSQMCGDASNIFVVADAVGDNPLEIRRLSYEGAMTAAPVASVPAPIFGTRLQQDFQYLYWLDAQGIRRVLKNSTVVRPDLFWAQDQLEVIQAVQDGSNSVKLIARKPTLVRAYPQASLGPVPYARAELHGQDGFGNPLPGSPIRSVDPWVERVNLAPDRGDLTRSFEFIIPDSWIPDTRYIHLRAVLDPLNTTIESDESNNSTSLQAFAFQRKDTVVLDCRRIRTHAGYGDVTDNNFGGIIARAAELLPVSDVVIRPIDGVMEEWEPSLFNPFRTGPWELNGEVCTVIGLTGCIDEDSWVNGRLWIEWLASEIPEVPVSPLLQPEQHHRLGMVHAFDDWKWGGLGTTVGHAMMVKMRGGGFGGQNSPFGGITLAHEFTHNMGYEHVNCGSGFRGGFDEKYPYPPCQIGDSTTDPGRVLGYDWFRGKLTEHDSTPYMSYSSNRWTTPYHWNGIENIIGSRGVTPPPGDFVLVVLGVYDPVAQETTILETRKLPRAAVSEVNLTTAWQEQETVWSTDGVGMMLRALDGLDQVQAVAPVGIGRSCCDLHVDRRFFHAVLPCDAGTRGAQISDDAGQAATPIKRASASAPVVTVTSPSAGALFTGTVTVTWTASDADGDALSATIQYTADNGQTWDTIASDIVGSSYTAGTLLPGSRSNPPLLPTSRFRVIVSDGFNTGSAESQTFTVFNRSPTVSFATPQPGQQFAAGEQIFFSAVGSDPEELAPMSYSWNLISGPVLLAGNSTVPHFVFRNGLPPGTYTAQVGAFDSQFMGGFSQVVFTVGNTFREPVTDSDGDGVADEIDNCPFTFNPLQLDDDGDGAGNDCDNCPGLANPEQADRDEDGIGDGCDPCVNGAVAAVGVDGSLDAVYGPALAVQTVQTSLFDSTSGDPERAAGSELDALHAFIDCDRLNLFIAGNLRIGAGGVAHDVDIFIDSRAGGVNRLLGGAPLELARFADDGSGNGLTFETGFEADYWIGVRGAERAPAVPGVECRFAPVQNMGLPAQYLGFAVAPGDGVLDNIGFDEPDIRVTVNNANTGGVTGGFGPSSGAGVNTGIELSIPLSALGVTTLCDFDVVVLLSSQERTSLSNQVLPPVPAGANLGEPRSVNLAAIGGEQATAAEGAIAVGPSASLRPLGSGYSFTAAVGLYTSAPHTVQWRRNGAPVSDNGRISGATEEVLTISPVLYADRGDYDVVITTDCGAEVRGPVTLTLPFCPCELDGTPGVNVFDLLAYLDLWFAGGLAADLDGVAGVSVFDLLVYLDCWFAASASGACP